MTGAKGGLKTFRTSVRGSPFVPESLDLKPSAWAKICYQHRLRDDKTLHRPTSRVHCPSTLLARTLQIAPQWTKALYSSVSAVSI
jgi:hypothetical protein